MPKQDNEDFIPGQDIFTQLELFQRAAKFGQFKLRDTSAGTSSQAVSLALAAIQLDDTKLRALAERGIKRQERPDDIFTLIDENPQGPKTPGFADSNYWNFKRNPENTGPFDLKIELYLELHISEQERGIVCIPMASGTMVSPCSHLANFRMFKALVEMGDLFPLFASVLAESDGTYTISWTNIHLGGVREISALFREFTRGSEPINELSRVAQIFHPSPHPTPNPLNRLYVTEPAQPRLFKRWKQQLDEYRNKLALL